MNDYKFILLLFTAHFTIINSFFYPKDAKKHNWDDESMKANEIRYALVPDYFYEECPLPERDYPEKPKLRQEKYFYFQKRKTDHSKDPSLPQYQFVVSSTDEFGM